MRELQNEEELCVFFVIHNTDWVKKELAPYKLQMLDAIALHPEEAATIETQFNDVIKEKLVDILITRLTVSEQYARVFVTMLNIKEFI